MNEIILIENKIFTIRNQQVMIDRDLAELYQVETKVLNQAVKRNIERFPSHFRFQLTDNEVNELVTICDRFEVLKHSSSNPYAFFKNADCKTRNNREIENLRAIARYC